MQHKVLVAIGVVAACVAVAQAVAKVDDDAVKANVSAEEHTYPAINFGEQVSQMTCSGAYKAECRAVGDAILHVFKGLEAAIEPYTITFTAAEAKMDDIAVAVGFDKSQLKYLFGLFAAYPLSLIMNLLPHPRLKHVFSLAVGLFYAQFVFGTMWVHSLLTATVVYLYLVIASFIPPMWRTIHVFVFVFMMAYMSFSHIFRIVDDYLGWQLDYTGPQMILTIKLSAIGYNLRDGTFGRKKTEEAAAADPKKEKDPRKSRKVAGLKAVSQDRLARSLSGVPDPLEYFAWIYCFQHFLAGPGIELWEFRSAMNRSENPPGRYLKALKCLILSVVFLGITAVAGPMMPIATLHNVEWVNSNPIMYRFGYAYLALFIVRTKYYFAWLNAEGSAYLVGFGHTPTNKQDVWSGASNMDVVDFETAENVRQGSRAWNKFTQSWLERYVYSRTGNSLAATYFVSAFWHGFYPGYYLFFMSVPLITMAGRELRSHLRPYVVGTSWHTVYSLVGRLMTVVGMNYLALAFQALALDYALFSWQGWFFSGHVCMIIAYVVAIMIPKKKAKKE